MFNDVGTAFLFLSIWMLQLLRNILRYLMNRQIMN